MNRQNALDDGLTAFSLREGMSASGENMLREETAPQKETGRSGEFRMRPAYGCLRRPARKIAPDQAADLMVFSTEVFSGAEVSAATCWARLDRSLAWPVRVSNCLRTWMAEISITSAGVFACRSAER